MRDSAGHLISPGPNFAKGRDTVCIYRPTLIALMTKIAVELGVKLRRGVTFDTIDNRVDGVMVTFTDGEQGSYGILIGADGFSSNTRQTLFPNSPTPEYAGRIRIRWLAPGRRVEDESWYASAIGRLGFYYLPEGIVYVPSVFTVPEDRRMDNMYLLDLFTRLLDSFTAPAITELRSRLTLDAKLVGRPFKWLLLPDPWYKHRAILIGDTAHATTAHMGMGGGMALEDAVVLAQCVRDNTSMENAFSSFMTRRYSRVETVVRTSVRLSELQQANAPPTENAALLSKAFATLASPY